ncbi:MAG: hypothetical protein V3V35_02555 [Dehalococcoidia bacterium]
MTVKPRPLPRPFSMPWGKGSITEEVQVVRDHWEPTIQLLQFDDGYRALRFCFYSRGRFNRNPMLLSEIDLDEMAEALETAPGIKALLGKLAR